MLRFGTDATCDVRLEAVVPAGTGLRFRLTWRDGPSLPVHLPLAGQHNARNAAGAAAAATALGLAPADIVAGLADVVVPGSRLRILEAPQGVHVVDDAYNANPGSVQAALGTLADLSGPARRHAALGDMLELGPQAAALHYAAGLYAGQSGVATVFALGQWAEETARGARAGGCEAAAFTDITALQAAVGQALRPGDWLLVKGSRGMRMERLVSSVVKGEV